MLGDVLRRVASSAVSADTTAATAVAELDPPEARELREKLVQVVSLEVADPRVRAALGAVPRHRFVREVPLGMAYADRPVPIGCGQTISQPTVVGVMSEALELEGNERILEIGTGSGYQAAVLCKLAREIDSIEIVPELAERARRVLGELGCTNVHVHQGDGWAGLVEHAPFDRIVVTAAPDVLPEALSQQLAEGGLLVVPVGGQWEDQRLERHRKTNGRLVREDLGAVRFVPMVHAHA
jgi:protein-L-isoaspartate(D-aspartate) O-methyltransferase